jgi:outer membrane protein assembly factor BamB
MMTKNGLVKSCLLGVSVLGLLAACDTFSKDKPPLPGERISVLELQKSLEPDDVVLEEQGLIAPSEWQNEFWPQAGGYPNHSMQNLALNPNALKKVWSTKIGKGSTDELPLVAQPVIVDGRIYAMDTKNTVAAFDVKNGKEIWRRDVSTEEDDDAVIGGGLATSGGLLYVTSGYNEVLALNPANGNIIWRKNIPAASRAAPTVLDNRVFVTTLDGRVLALDAANGTSIWEYTGIAESAALVGAASPAVSRDIVVPVFSSGEITALRVGNGSVAWTDNLSNVKGVGGLAEISDIKALPVIDKGVVVAISFSGRLAAIDERTGARVWQREISGQQTPWMAGNHMFVLSADNQVIALGRETGAIRWVTELPRYDDDKALIFTGPVLAGGRLIVAGSQGRVYEISPNDGQILKQWKAHGNITLPPIIAGGTLYLLSDDGELSAYR